MNKILKLKEIRDLTEDYSRCDFYLNNLNIGNIKYLNESIDFSNQKYREFCIKDAEVTFMNTNFFPTNLDDLSQTKQNLIAIKKIISEIVLKKEMEMINNEYN